MTRTEEDGTITVLASDYMGSRLNSPNDLALDRKGRIYFTDPRYGDRSDMEMEVEGVYRIDPNGALTRIIEHLQRPNGIGVSPDQQTLYVVDNNSTEGGSRKVWSYPLASDGSVGTARLLRDFGTGRGGGRHLPGQKGKGLRYGRVECAGTGQRLLGCSRSLRPLAGRRVFRVPSRARGRGHQLYLRGFGWADTFRHFGQDPVHYEA